MFLDGIKNILKNVFNQNHITPEYLVTGPNSPRLENERLTNERPEHLMTGPVSPCQEKRTAEYLVTGPVSPERTNNTETFNNTATAASRLGHAITSVMNTIKIHTAPYERRMS